MALAAMPALRGLSVSCLNVDDEGIAALPAFPALRELMPMDVPDAGYRHIGKCDRLESLILMYCRDTTDAATEHITGLPNLSYYFNSYTTITDRTPELLSTMDSPRAHHVRYVSRSDERRHRAAGTPAEAAELRCLRTRSHTGGPRCVPVNGQGVLWRMTSSRIPRRGAAADCLRASSTRG